MEKVRPTKEIFKKSHKKIKIFSKKLLQF